MIVHSARFFFRICSAIMIILTVFNVGLAADVEKKANTSSVPAPKEEAGSGDLGDKTNLLKQDFHPKLKRILNVKDDAEIEFLKKISQEDQNRLADLIRRGIDTHSSLLLQQLAYASNFFPAILLGKFSPMAGPELAARMSSYVSPERAIKIARHTDPKFLAETVYYLQPSKVAPLMEATPDKLLIEVSDIIIKKKDYYLMAEFADYLSVAKAKSLVFSLDDPEVMLHVAYYMKNTKLLGDTIAALPPEYVTRLITRVIDLGYFEMSAKLSQRLAPDQIVMLMDKIDPAYVVKIAMHYPPELVIDVMGKLNDQHKRLIAEKLTQRLSVEEIAQILSQADPDYVARVAALFPPELVVEAMGKMGDEYINKMSLALSDLLGGDQLIKLMDKFEPSYVASIAIHFPPEVAKKILDKLGDKQVDELTTMISQRMSAEQIVMLMDKIGPADVANIVIHYPPELVLSVMEKLNESQIRLFMEKVRSQLNPDEIAKLLNLAKPEYVTRIMANYPPELILEIIGKLGEDAAHEIATKLSNEMTAEQIVQLMDRVDPAYVVTIAMHFPPELAVRVMQKLDAEHANQVAAKLSQRLDADQIVKLMDKADPSYVATIVLYCPPEMISAILSKLDDAEIQLISEKFSKQLTAAEIVKILNQAKKQTGPPRPGELAAPNGNEIRNTGNTSKEQVQAR